MSTNAWEQIRFDIVDGADGSGVGGVQIDLEATGIDGAEDRVLALINLTSPAKVAELDGETVQWKLQNATDGTPELQVNINLAAAKLLLVWANRDAG